MKDGIGRSLNTFLTFPDETLLMAKRQHWIVLLPPLLFLFLIGSFLAILSILLFSFLLSFHLHTVILLLILSSIFTFFITKTTVEWFFHIYVVTNRKILEFSYVPLSHFMVNDVILDQVRCTEIDVQADGIINDLLDIGTISICFDRPTHQEEFHITRIHQARETASFLACELIGPHTFGNKQKVTETWFRSKDNPKKYTYREEIIPEEAGENGHIKEKLGGILYG